MEGIMVTVETATDIRKRAEKAFPAGFRGAVAEYFISMGTPDHVNARWDLAQTFATQFGLGQGERGVNAMYLLLGVMEAMSGQVRNELHETQNVLLDHLDHGVEASGTQAADYTRAKAVFKARGRVPFE